MCKRNVLLCVCVILPGHICWMRLWDYDPRNTDWWERSCSAGSTDTEVLLNFLTTHTQTHMHLMRK